MSTKNVYNTYQGYDIPLLCVIEEVRVTNEKNSCIIFANRLEKIRCPGIDCVKCILGAEAVIKSITKQYYNYLLKKQKQKQDVIVHCPTEELYDRVIEACEKTNILEKKNMVEWKRYNIDTCIRLSDNGWIGSKLNYISRKYNVISAQEYLGEETKKEKLCLVLSCRTVDLFKKAQIKAFENGYKWCNGQKLYGVWSKYKKNTYLCLEQDKSLKFINHVSLETKACIIVSAKMYLEKDEETLYEIGIPNTGKIITNINFNMREHIITSNNKKEKVMVIKDVVTKVYKDMDEAVLVNKHLNSEIQDGFQGELLLRDYKDEFLKEAKRLQKIEDDKCK